MDKKVFKGGKADGGIPKQTDGSSIERNENPVKSFQAPCEDGDGIAENINPVIKIEEVDEINETHSNDETKGDFLNSTGGSIEPDENTENGFEIPCQVGDDITEDINPVVKLEQVDDLIDTVCKDETKGDFLNLTGDSLVERDKNCGNGFETPLLGSNDIAMNIKPDTKVGLVDGVHESVNKDVKEADRDLKLTIENDGNTGNSSDTPLQVDNDITKNIKSVSKVEQVVAVNESVCKDEVRTNGDILNLTGGSIERDDNSGSSYKTSPQVVNDISKNIKPDTKVEQVVEVNESVCKDEERANGDSINLTGGSIERDENSGTSFETPLQVDSDVTKIINPVSTIEQVGTINVTVCNDPATESTVAMGTDETLKCENTQDTIRTSPPKIEGDFPGENMYEMEVESSLLGGVVKNQTGGLIQASKNQVSSEGVKIVEAVENGRAKTKEDGLDIKGVITEEMNGGSMSEIAGGAAFEGKATSSDEQMDTTMSHHDAKEDTSAKDVTLAEEKKKHASCSMAWRAKRSRYRKTRSLVCYSSSSTTSEDIDTDASQHEEPEERLAPDPRPKPSSAHVPKRPLQATSSEESEPDKDSLLSLSSFDSNSDSEIEEVKPKPRSSSARNRRKNKEVGKSKPQIYEDLPPIEDLHITVKKEECIPVGTVYSIVNSIVVIESLQGTPPLNLDSVLFKEDGESVGKIFDVFGPVSRPFYALRFTDEENLKSKGIDHGITVYCAPQTEHTAYVFTYQLMKDKGSDASWKQDEEPPPEFLDYSDDEQEMIAKKNLRQAKLNKSKPSEPGAPTTKRFSVNRVFENQPKERQKARTNNSNFGDPIPLSGNAWQSDDDVGWHNRAQLGRNQQHQPQPGRNQQQKMQPGRNQQHQMQPAINQQHQMQPGINQQHQMQPGFPCPQQVVQLQNVQQIPHPPPVFCANRPPMPFPSQPCPLHFWPQQQQQQPPPQQRPLPIPSPPPHRFGCPPTFQVVPQERFPPPPPTFY